MDVDEAVRGARLLASDIERSLGVTVEISTEYRGSWPTLRELLGRPEPSGWVQITVPAAGTSAALDPTEPGSVTAEGFAMELARSFRPISRCICGSRGRVIRRRHAVPI
ncbi:hypothetical protein ACWCPQ_32905 [Nocardia sp. NPDC001965]